MFVNSAIYWETPIALGIAERPLSADLVVQCLENVEVESALLPPVLLAEISHDLEQIKQLAKLRMVVFGGGK